MSNPPEAFPTFLGDRYELTELLGRGAMGSVYRARDRHLDREVALKVVREEQAPQRLERFRREGEITASLSHPGIVRLLTSGVVDGFPYLAYELLEGCQTLGEALPGRTLNERVALIRDAAKALGHAHAKGVIHRDVKNENLLVDRDGSLRVADFGLATAAGLERLTRTGALVGTPTHMSPEMIRGKEGIGPATDVWGLGVVLYQALTGKLPFEAATFTELTARILNGNYEDPRRGSSAVPGALVAVCAKALSVDPQRRYPDGEALAADLDAWLEGRTPSAQPFGPQLVVAGVVLIAGVLAAGWALTRPATPAPSPRASVEPTSGPEEPVLPLPPLTPAPSPGVRPGTRLAVLRHDRGRTYGMFLSAREALTWGDDGTLRRWDLVRRAERRRLPAELGRLTAVARVGDGVVVAGTRGVSWIPDLNRREPPRRLLGPPGAYAILALPLRKSVLVGRANKELVEIDLQTAQIRRRLASESHPVYVLARSPDGSRLLTASGDPIARIGLGDHRVRVIDAERGERVGKAYLQARGSALLFLSSAPDDTRFLVGTGIGRLAEYGADGEPRGEFISKHLSPRVVLKPRAHEGTVLDLVFGPKRARVFSLSCGAVVDRELDSHRVVTKVHTEVRCWRLSDRQELGEGLVLDGQRTYGLDVSPDGKQLLIGGEARVELWTAP